jgi:hypothetical protein
MSEFEYVTSEETVATYEATQPMFEGLIKEVRVLSSKKPEATMSEGKVKIVNRILADLLTILKGEPEGKYLDLLSDHSLPQVSDAVLMMVQFETALEAFKHRYYRYLDGVYYWMTPSSVEEIERRRSGDYEEEDVDADDGEEEDGN